MRVVIVGASRIAVSAAKQLLEQNHTVVLIDTDREKLDLIAEEIDCGMVHGDGSLPHILKEAAGEDGADVLVPLTNYDQNNIVSALIGRSVGFERVMPQIVEADLFPVCRELGLHDAITPQEMIAKRLVDALLHDKDAEMDNSLPSSARLFAITVNAEGPDRLGDLELPQHSRAICIVEGTDYDFCDDDTTLAEGQTVLVLTDEDGFSDLTERYG